nr:hypothetical transcript [Hymenolepis microstoma]
MIHQRSADGLDALLVRAYHPVHIGSTAQRPMAVACPSHSTPRIPVAEPTHVTNGNASLKEHTLPALFMPCSFSCSHLKTAQIYLEEVEL